MQSVEDMPVQLSSSHEALAGSAAESTEHTAESHGRSAILNWSMEKMKTLMHDAGTAFSEAMIHGRHRIIRWIVLLLCWGLALTCWMLAILAFVSGSIGQVK